MRNMKYTKEQYQKCAELCGVTAESIRQYVSKYKLDPTDPEAFQLQHTLLIKKKSVSADEETEAAKKQRLVAQAKKEEVLLEKAELDLMVSKDKYISIEEVEDYNDRLGTLIKTSLEPLPRQMSIMLEGKTAKEIENELAEKVQQILSALANVKPTT